MSEPENSRAPSNRRLAPDRAARPVDSRLHRDRHLLGVLTIWPGPSGLYDLAGRAADRQHAHRHRTDPTGVISPFLVPLKIPDGGVPGRAAGGALPGLGVRRAGPVFAREAHGAAAGDLQHTALLRRRGFCYFFVFGKVFAFIQSFAPKSVSAMPDIEAYLSFVLTMFIAFGTAFEVPIAVVVLARLGVVSIEKLKAFRAYFIVLAFIIAAVLTPPDIVSQLSLAIPMCLLYEVGIVRGRRVHQAHAGAAEDKTSSV